MSLTESIVEDAANPGGNPHPAPPSGRGTRWLNAAMPGEAREAALEKVLRCPAP